MFGLDPKSIAESQIDSYKPGEGRQRDIGDKFGDAAMWLLTGGQIDYAKEVDRLTKEKYIEEKLEKPFGTSRINKADRVTGYEKLGDLGNYSPTKLKRALLEREGTRNARNATAILTGQDPSEFATLTDPGAIEASGARFIKEERNAKERKAEQKLDFEREREFQESNRRYNNSRQDRIRDLADRVDLKRESLALNRLQMQMDQGKYMYELETRRQDAREKRTSALVQALAALGGAFAI